jgi:energy-coupling factor transporter ATP-binding protein EcfA2
MSRIRIKNFGPIKEGFTETLPDGTVNDWLEVKKVTVFIGNQGSGKSTVAKLYSTFSWIEKAMVLGVIRQDELNLYNRFLKQLAYQRIDEYVREGTNIEYAGKAFNLSFKDGRFEASKAVENGYVLPKIMYTPSERNFLSTVDRPDKIKGLPKTLYTFNDEFDAAKNLYSEGIELPINKVSFEYDKLNKLAHIVGENRSYKLRLSEASSGFQSTVPLFLVTKYLCERLTSEADPSVQESSLEDQKKIDKEVKAILDDPQLTPEVLQSYLRQLSAKRKRACLVNIVEEPEQNLFPSSQKKVLESLIKFNNQVIASRLIITTHSPYLINYLTLAVKAFSVYAMLKERHYNLGDPELSHANDIVPMSSTVEPNDLVIYQLDETNGSIGLLPMYKGLPSDENKLNYSLEDTNELFAQLQEIEKGWR